MWDRDCLRRMLRAGCTERFPLIRARALFSGSPLDVVPIWCDGWSQSLAKWKWIMKHILSGEPADWLFERRCSCRQHVMKGSAQLSQGDKQLLACWHWGKAASLAGDIPKCVLSVIFSAIVIIYMIFLQMEKLDKLRNFPGLHLQTQSSQSSNSSNKMLFGFNLDSYEELQIILIVGHNCIDFTRVQ